MFYPPFKGTIDLVNNYMIVFHCIFKGISFFIYLVLIIAGDISF